MIFHELNDKNFLFFAIKSYNNEQCVDVKEFYNDLKRFQYLKKLFIRYEQKKDLKINLILNHIIVICNIFGIENGLRMLLFKISKNHHSILKPFLLFLNYLPLSIAEISMLDVKADCNIEDKLKEI